MRRRDFITLLSGAAVAWPLAARAQQAAQLPTIGFFSPSAASAQMEWTAAFLERLRERGWIEGTAIRIEYRWAEGRIDRLPEIAAELVRLKVKVIVAGGSLAVAAAKQATAVIPIVICPAGDPVGTGLVASLAHPGGNVTGVSMQNTDTGTKRLQLLREIVPTLRHLAVLADVGFPEAPLELREIQKVGTQFGLDVSALEIRRAEEIAPALVTLKGRADALYVCGGPLVATNRVRIVTLALGLRLPTAFNYRDYVTAGGLLSYGPDMIELHRSGADIVDKILRGAKPADIPVQQPTKFDLGINLTTAMALGITFPDSILALANEVIE
jgi:putative tryptophan/tyrosine transport system substrate-binding protein